MVCPRQGINSTRKDRQATIDARLQVNDMNPAEEVCTAINNKVFCFAALADTTKGTIYSDLTGRFLLQSYTGMQYIFIAYVYDQNYIIIRLMKNRSNASMIKVFKDVYKMLQQKGTNPSLHVLDNECSKAIKQNRKRQYNSSSHTTIASTPRSVLYKLSKTTLSVASALPTKISHSNFGTISLNKQSSHATSFDARASIQKYQRTSNSMVTNMTGMHTH